MIDPLRATALALASTTLMAVTPQETYSAQQLALLDPTVRMASLCTGKGGPQSMRARLALAAAVVQAAPLPSVPLHDDLGKVHFPITTANPLAQRYFDQGLSYAYGFNHAAAIASFRAGQAADPNCAMCYWGEAMAHGPNINAPMDPATNARSVALASYANWLAAKATEPEQALTGAMLKRYSVDPKADRATLDAAYADAMLAAARAHPDNDDIAVLAAESAMDTLPWNYWTPDKSPQPRLGEAVQLIETVYARNADHPQAAHLYIHLMENGPDPKRAEAAADRLYPLAPGAGHLVHMPAHIYYRLGRWKDSMRVNIDAARADEASIKASGDRGLVRYGYYPHNVHFIVTSAQMAGDMKTAVTEARRLSAILDPATSAQIAWIQAINAAPYFAASQFAAPGQVLAMNEPDKRLPYVGAMRHYARATAYANLHNKVGFDREIGALSTLRQSGAFQPMIDQGVPATDLILLAETVARARFASSSGRLNDAIKLYRDAIEVEARIPYMEPPFWYYPVRQSLGAALLMANRPEEAAEVFKAALKQSPGNGWVIYGLKEAQTKLGDEAGAKESEAALAKAWAGSPDMLALPRL